MAKYVCNGAKMKCSMGSAQADLGVIPTGRCPVYIKGNLMATMTDHKPFVNIKAFGQCQSLANPAVAAATAANNGRLQKMPCVPNTATPWVGAKMNVLISGEPVLLDNSKLMCAWLGMIEITDAGHDLVSEGAAGANAAQISAAPEDAAGEVGVTIGNDAEEDAEILEKITVKDIAGILKQIETDKGYEAARHYAMNELDYWKMNLLAKRYINAPDDETREKEKDNDPNIMPTRFMLLYGADDGKLECIDDDPDNIVADKTYKICVKDLRDGLRQLGYDYVDEDGAFDDHVEHAFLTYHWKHGRVKIGGTCKEDDDPEKPLDRAAEKYGVYTWKYIDEKYDGAADHDRITEELSAKLGDELLADKCAEKGIAADPRRFKPGISYHYVWVPFCADAALPEGYEDGEDIKYQIFHTDQNNKVKCAAEGTAHV